jgi:hypothetical protein
VKTCFKCKRELDTNEFYRHPKMADGLLGKCKDCTKSDVRENREGKIEKYRDYDAMRYYRDHEKRKEVAGRWGKSNPELARKHKAAYRDRNPGKTEARTALGNAVRDGKVCRLPCEKCGSTHRVHGHHEDYSRPLDVVWLCASCHGRRHGEINRAKRT